MPYKKKFIESLQRSLRELIHVVTREEKKVIALDCDNTLWKGIVGEDGVDGIVCDKTADGVVHHHFQTFLKQKQREGFVLCLASKNNPDDVRAAFEGKRMPLGWNDFVVREISWEHR